MSEDDRIEMIGRQAEMGKRTGFFVEDEEKADRYIRKLLDRFAVVLVSRIKSPVEGVVIVTIGPTAPLN